MRSPLTETAGLQRREFLATASALTLGVALAGRAGPGLAAGDAAVNSWLTIGSDGRIVFTIGASDMGQGSVQGLAQILAEDLMVDPAAVDIVQGGPTLTSPAPIGTSINTVGSSVTRSNYWRLRDAAASARETLVLAAMNRMGDGDRSHYLAAQASVRHLPTGQALSYAQLAPEAARLPPVANAPLVPDAAFRSIGKPLPRPDIPSKVDGSACYGIDVRLPGMVFAAVRHCPTFGGTLASVPPTPAGAIALVPLSVTAGTARGADLAGQVNAFAVVATTTWDAMRLARRVTPQWTLPPQAASVNSAQILADAKALALQAPAYVPGGANPPGTAYTVESSVASADDALARHAGRAMDVGYSLPYLPHACMEVLNCTVDYVAGQRCTIHAPTQSARGALQLAVAMTGLTEGQVQVRVTRLGGGLGRKAEQDFVAQAIQLGMRLQRPVQLVWPREEDFTHDQYRPMAHVRVRAALDPQNQVAAWLYRNVSPSILAQRGVALGPRGDSQGYEASHALPYSFGARRTEWVSHPAQIPVGFWRSVGASINTFAVESAIDELAALARIDPLQFRRGRLTDPRWLAVLDLVAAASAWTTPRPTGTALGLAIGSAFNSVAATVVEVTGSSATAFTIRRVWVAFDGYLIVNPLNVEAQLVGGVVHGINAALYGQQTFINGAAQRRNFNAHRMIRPGEMPQVSVALVPPPTQSDRAQPIGGVGELGVPTLAPALANAVARLCGTRVRSLPFFPNATMGGL